MMITALLRAAVLAAALFAACPLAAGESGGNGEQLPVHVRLRPMSVPLMRGVYREGSFDLQILLALDSPEDKSRVEALLPRLEAAYFRDMSELARLYVGHGRTTDIKLVGEVLQRATDRVTGPHAARVLIQEAMVRR